MMVAAEEIIMICLMARSGFLWGTELFKHPDFVAYLFHAKV